MIIREILAKAILSKSRVHDFTLNAYVGCEHGCTYCYARFMKRFTGHREAWGEFVDVKRNAAELTAREARKRNKGTVWISGVCDAYQPLEEKYKLTRSCLETLVDHGWPINIQTKSPLVLRDLDILKRAADVEVGFTITTADEGMRRIFEPAAPAIQERIRALGILHDAGIRTFVMVAPLLPGAHELVGKLKGKVDHALIDRDNYFHADWAYKKHGIEWAKDDLFFQGEGKKLKTEFDRVGIPCRKLF